MCTGLYHICNIKYLVLSAIVLSSLSLSAQEKDSLDDSSVDLYTKLIESGSVKNGIFNIYNLEKDFYFEIPDSLFSRDFLIVNKVSKVPYALNGHGLNKGMAYETKMIRFYNDTTLNKVWVKTINPRVQSPSEDNITRSVRDNFGESIIEYFDVEAKSNDSTSIIIKVNKVFDGTEKSFGDLLSNTGLGGSIKTQLSRIDQVKTFPRNIFVKSTLSTSVTEGKSAALPLSVGVSCNIVLLPDDVMKPRFSDFRIGYFTSPMDYYSDEQHEVDHKDMITRWRVEPRPEDIERYKRGELVRPKKQIVYHLDPSTPKKWIPFIEKGVYDWNVAFERAGFKDVLVVKHVDENDQDFDVDDVRYSVITYAASAKQNAMGPSVVDPRSGEILEADIIWWHNLMKGLHSWLRIQTGTINPASSKNRFPDELMGEAIRFVSSHEVGHTFGLKHNMGASHSFPVDSLRSATFTARMGGTAPSIMDYARYNYVAQPGDNITAMRPQIGVYDTYAIDWGYRWIDSKSPHDEFGILDSWIRKHENDPDYFYGPQQSKIIDPRSQSEDLGDDSVKASEYGLMNLKRILPKIIEWTQEKGKEYYKASKLYRDIIAQWELYNNHVMANIGGVYLDNATYDNDKSAYIAVPTVKQKKALEYLIHNAITPQKWLFAPESMDKVLPARDAPDGARYYSLVSLMRMYQNTSLYNLLSTDRLMRIAENRHLQQGSKDVFTEEYFFDRLYDAIFQKTKKGRSLDMYDRITQNNYIDVLLINRKQLLKKTSESSMKDIDVQFKNVHFDYLPRVSDAAALKRGELRRILQLLKKKRKKGNRITKYHYDELISKIENHLKK